MPFVVSELWHTRTLSAKKFTCGFTKLLTMLNNKCVVHVTLYMYEVNVNFVQPDSFIIQLVICILFYK